MDLCFCPDKILQAKTKELAFATRKIIIGSSLPLPKLGLPEVQTEEQIMILRIVIDNITSHGRNTLAPFAESTKQKVKHIK